MLCATPAAAAPLTASAFTLCLAGAVLVSPETLWTAYSLAPQVVIPLLAFAGLYAKHAARALLGTRHVAAFAAGWLLLALALISPLCRLAATLASAHMVQHVILVALAPPLLVLGLAPDLRRRFAVLGPVPAGLVYGATIWIWHVPGFYEAALADPLVHLALYASLLAAAMVFWSSLGVAIVGADRDRVVPVLFFTLVHTGLLGALLTFAPWPWYGEMAPGALAFGMTPLEDQQLAGLIMWVPMGALYVVGALAAVLVLLDAMEREAARTRI